MKQEVTSFRKEDAVHEAKKPEEGEDEYENSGQALAAELGKLLDGKDDATDEKETDDE